MKSFEDVCKKMRADDEKLADAMLKDKSILDAVMYFCFTAVAIFIVLLTLKLIDEISIFLVVDNITNLDWFYRKRCI